MKWRMSGTVMREHRCSTVFNCVGVTRIPKARRRGLNLMVSTNTELNFRWCLRRSVFVSATKSAWLPISLDV
jgi:hypothetical protein